MSTSVVVDATLSYPNLFEPRQVNPTSPAKYSVTLLVPKTDTAAVEALKAAQQEAFTEGVASTFKGKTPKKWGAAVKDADVDTNKQGDTLAETHPEYEGHYVVNASSSARFKPSVVDRKHQPVIDPTQVYPGVGAKVAVRFYAYSVNGNLGVAAGLNAVMITDTTKPSLSGTPSLQALFGAPDSDEEEID